MSPHSTTFLWFSSFATLSVCIDRCGKIIRSRLIKVRVIRWEIRVRSHRSVPKFCTRIQPPWRLRANHTDSSTTTIKQHPEIGSDAWLCSWGDQHIHYAILFMRGEHNPQKRRYRSSPGMPGFERAGFCWRDDCFGCIRTKKPWSKSSPHSPAEPPSSLDGSLKRLSFYHIGKPSLIFLLWYRLSSSSWVATEGNLMANVPVAWGPEQTPHLSSTYNLSLVP